MNGLKPMSNDLSCVRSFASRFEAGFAQGFLESSGIWSWVQADDSGGTRPYLLMGSGGVFLLVRPADFENASRLLNEVLATEVEASEQIEEEA